MGITEIELGTVVQYCTERYGVKHKLILGTPLNYSEIGIRLIVPEDVDEIFVAYTDEAGFSLTHKGINAWGIIAVALFPSDLNENGSIDVSAMGTVLIFKGECADAVDLAHLERIQNSVK